MDTIYIIWGKNNYLVLKTNKNPLEKQGEKNQNKTKPQTPQQFGFLFLIFPLANPWKCLEGRHKSAMDMVMVGS